MAGSLLVSGSPQHYKAIGEGGQLVYAVAFQLREAIRLKAGASVANCLAIPQSNQHGSMVDWYGPVQGDVVPWSAASSAEREYALSKLDAAHRLLEAAIAKMRQTESRSTQAEREINTVLPLMSKVFYFPDTQFIYLVNGEPVIAFWGFHPQDVRLPTDPFSSLRPLPTAPLASTPASAVSENKRHRWWWWLLLLLLLLLLLFFLRSCVPTTWFGQEQVPALTAPATPTQPLTPDARRTSPDAVVNPANPQSPTGWVDRGISSVQRWFSGENVQTEGATREGTTSSEAPTGQATPEPIQTASVPDALAAPGVGPSSGPSTSPNVNPSLDPSANAPQTPEIPSPGQPDPATQNSARGQQTTPPPQSTAQPPGDPMTIPPQAQNSGNMRFLDGAWTAGTGIQDAKTGKPLRIEYDFSQGNGQGKVTIRRADGSQCVGAVGAQMQGKTLQINDKGVAKCSDGGTMTLPKVVCMPQPDGRADCQGRYENGTTFPVSMRHAPK